MKRFASVIHALFVLSITAFMLISGVRAFLSPVEINEYENRTAEKLPRFSLAGFMDGSFQDGTESALGDQTVFAIQMKEVYNRLTAGMRLAGLRALSSLGGDDAWAEFGGRLYKDGYLLAKVRSLEKERPGIDGCVSKMNAAAAAVDVPVHVYYVKREEDITYATGEENGFYEYLKASLETSGLYTSVDCYSVPVFADYKRDFYKTDHHWNAVGADRGYREVLAILAPAAQPIPHPAEPIRIPYLFSGSHARAVGASGVITEEITAYDYALPEVSVTFNRETTSTPNYGGRQFFLSGAAAGSTVTYADFYGYDVSRIVFDNPHDSGGEHVLLIGDSFDNAILWLLAGHFDTLHSVDLRQYEAEMGEKFSFSRYAAENGITRVMFIGSNDFYCSTLSLLED